MRRMKPGAIAAAAVAIVTIFAVAELPGCGVKSAPVAPEYARPERILTLRAKPGVAGIDLTWERPTRYYGGHQMRDLSSFVVMRGEGDGPMTPLVEIPVTDRERFQIEDVFSYLDVETKLGSRYRYTVIAEAGGAYRSEPSNEVELMRTKPPLAPNPDTYQLPAPSASPTDTP
jgi:hypothetical protein